MENHQKAKKSKKNPIQSYIDGIYSQVLDLERRGEYEKAIRLYDRILEFNPNDHEALLWKNQLINLQGKKEQMYS